LSSLEPGDLTDHLLDVLAGHDCCVPHLHLPLQSGRSEILRRMNRQYDVDDYLGMVERVWDVLDRPAISTDVLVGFPGETDADFEATLDVARRVGFCKIHAFRFSAREGTAAARWKNRFVNGRVARERLDRLKELERATAHRFQQQFIGSVERVIVEGGYDHHHRPDGEAGLMHGRGDRYFEVFFEAPPPDPPRAGDVVYVRVDRAASAGVSGMRGTLVRAPSRDMPLAVVGDDRI
jgi:tRNA A37 methylthiotransferase MiaB